MRERAGPSRSAAGSSPEARAPVTSTLELTDEGNSANAGRQRDESGAYRLPSRDICNEIRIRVPALPNAQKDLASVVTELRRQREAWAKAEASGATRAPRGPKRAPQAATTIDDLGLDDL